MGRAAFRPIRAIIRFARAYQNLIFVAIAFGSTLGLAIGTGHWVFYRATYILGALVPACLIWARLNLSGLDVTVERGSDRLQVGQTAQATVRMSSRSVFTKLWLQVEDQTDMPGPPARTIVTVPSKSNRNWKIGIPCERRGSYTVGPIRVTTGDPFGLFRFGREYGDQRSVLVLPRAEELPYFWSPIAQLPGDGVVRKRTHYVTPNASGVREYYPGDSLNRIHWPSTARLGRLMVKTFEMDPTSNIWLMLDMDSATQAGEGNDSTEEYGVRIATSLANHFLQAERLLGLMAHGEEKLTLDPARGSKQYGRILETLAMARADGRESIAEVLANEARTFGRNTTLILITSSLSEEWLASVQEIIQHGTRVAVVFVDPEGFGGGSSEQMIAMLTATGILTYVVREGSDIGLTLGPSGLAEERPRELQKAGAR